MGDKKTPTKAILRGAITLSGAQRPERRPQADGSAEAQPRQRGNPRNGSRARLAGTRASGTAGTRGRPGAWTAPRQAARKDSLQQVSTPVGRPNPARVGQQRQNTRAHTARQARGEALIAPSRRAPGLSPPCPPINQLPHGAGKGPRRRGKGGRGERGATRRNDTIERGPYHCNGWAVYTPWEDLIAVNVCVFSPQTITKL